MSFSFLFWWLLFWYLLLSLAVAFYADQRGRNAFGFFFLGLFFTPVLAFLFATNNPNKKAIAQRVIASGARQCPFCAEQIKAEAIKCQHCGSAVGTGAAYRFRCKLFGNRSPDSTTALSHAGSTHGLRGTAMDESIGSLATPRGRVDAPSNPNAAARRDGDARRDAPPVAQTDPATRT